MTDRQRIIAAGVATALLTPPPCTGAPHRANFVLADLTALSNPSEPNAGTVFIQPTDGEPSTVWVSADPLRSPVAVAVDSDLRVLVLDRTRRPDGIATGTGALVRYDRVTRAFLDETGSESFVALRDVGLLPSGAVLVVDRDADPTGLGSDTGALFRVDAPGSVTPFAADAAFVDPVGVVVAPDGRVFVVDENANPLGHPGDAGAVFEIDPETGVLLQVLAAPAVFSSPSDGVVLGGTLYVADRTADSAAGALSGQLFAVDVATGAVTPHLVNPVVFGALVDVEVFEGTLYLLDRDATFGGFGGAPGGVYRVSPSGEPLPFASSADWAEPQSLAYLPPATVALDRHDLVDGNGGGLNPADTVRVAVDVSPLVGAPVSFTLLDTLEAGATLVPGSLTTSAGTASVLSTSPPVVSWSASVTASASLSFEGIVPAIIPLRGPFTSRLAITDDTGGRLTSVVKDTIVRSTTPEEVVLSDPVSFFFTGRIGIIRAGGDSLDIVLDDPRLFNPAGVAIDDAGVVFIADRDVDLDMSARFRGALFTFDVEAATFDVFATDTTWVDPVAVDLYTDGRVLLLERRGGPPGNPGRGALYVLDRQTAEVLSIVTDARFVTPSGLHVTTSGDVLIADRDANPGGYSPPNNGAIFRVSPSGTVSVDLQSPRFVDPTGVLALRDGAYLIGDVNANPFNLPGAPGALFFGTSGGTASVVASNGAFAGPSHLVRLPDGDVLFTDTSGRVFIVDRRTRATSVYLDHPNLAAPDGIAVAPFPLFWESGFTSLDVNGGKLVGGDELDVTLTVRNTGRQGDDITLTSAVPPYTTLVPGSPAASAGTVTVTPDGRTIEWSGSVLSGVEIDIDYALLLDPSVGMETAIAQAANVVPERAVPVAIVDTVRTFGPFLPGDLVVADTGAGGGALLRRNRATAAADVVASGPPFDWPAGITVDGERRILIADRDADPFGLGGEPGALLRYDATTDALTPVASSSAFVSPVDVLVTSTGRTIVVDQDADPFALGGTPGALFDVDPSTGDITPLASDAAFRAPLACVEEPAGTLLLLDRDAVLGGSTGSGALFRVAMDGTVTPLGTGLDWVIPSDILFHPDGTILICDREADPNATGGTGAVFRLNPVTFAVTVYAADASFFNPIALGVDPDGNVLVMDTGNAATGPGLWLVDETSGGLVPLWFPNALDTPTGFLFLDQPSLAGAVLAASDVDGPPLLPADRLRYALTVPNAGTGPVNPLEVEITTPLEGALDPGSITSTPSGTIKIVSNRILGLVTLPAGDTLRVAFDVVLDPGVAPGTPIETLARVNPGGGFAFTLRDEQRIPFEFAPNDLLVLDRAMGLLRWDDVARAFTVVPTFGLEAPGALCLDAAGDIAYVVDAEADVAGTGEAGGGLFAFGARDGRFLASYASAEFRDPSGAFLDEDGSVVVVDANADPDSTGQPHGALFSVNPSTGAVTLRVRHPSFVEPVAGMSMGDGTWLVVDRDADPEGLGGDVGTLFRVDPALETVTVLESGTFLVDPVGVTIGPDGRWFILDESADVGGVGGDTGCVFEFLPGANVVVPVVVNEALTSPTAIAVGSQSEIYLCDVTALARGLSGHVLRYHPADGGVTSYASGPALTNPVGVAFFDSPTPVSDVGLSVSTQTGAVADLSWRTVTSDVVRVDVLRRRVDTGRTVLLTDQGLSPELRAYRDATVRDAGVYAYQLGLTERDGTSTLSHSVSIALAGTAPVAAAIGVGSPNPAGSTYRFWVDVPVNANPVRVSVFDVAGRRVRTLLEEPVAPGRHAVAWDLRTDTAVRVAAGVYFVRLDAAGDTRTRRIVVVR